MKIGAGGLQSLASQEVAPVRRIDPASAVRREDVFPHGAPPVEGEVNREELVKAAGRLNRAAEAYNQPLEFLVREDEGGRSLVELVDRESGTVRAQVPPEVVLAAAREPMKTIGLLIDMYL
ncbi:MAG: flagellar protein FlaG [Thermoanaerobacteraceae bacterium]|nr:flagellar protein FlaG [Thermoanaerobacteraceae bacterium]